MNRFASALLIIAAAAMLAADAAGVELPLPRKPDMTKRPGEISLHPTVILGVWLTRRAIEGIYWSELEPGMAKAKDENKPMAVYVCETDEAAPTSIAQSEELRLSSEKDVVFILVRIKNEKLAALPPGVGELLERCQVASIPEIFYLDPKANFIKTGSAKTTTAITGDVNYMLKWTKDLDATLGGMLEEAAKRKKLNNMSGYIRALGEIIDGPYKGYEAYDKAWNLMVECDKELGEKVKQIMDDATVDNKVKQNQLAQLRVAYKGLGEKAPGMATLKEALAQLRK